MGGVIHYLYQNNTPYHLERIIDPSGVSVLEVTYDPSGRVESYQESGESFSYRYQPNRVIKTDNVGDKTFYGIDNFGSICAITYPDGSTTKEVYENNTSTVIDTGGNTFIREFDKRGRKIREQRLDAVLLNPTVLYTYEGDNPYPITEETNNKVTAHTYDEHYNLTSTTYSDGTTESYAYDDRGNRISYTDAEGVTTSYAYNTLGQPIRICDALGGITQMVYDDLGNKTAIIDPQERITQFEYDKLSRIVTIIDTDKTTTHFYHDNAGRLSAIRDPLGNMTRYAYDSDGLLFRLITPSDQLRTFERKRGRLSAITREDGVVYRFEYDKRGRRISQSIGEKTILYTYDSLGNLLSVKDPSGSSEGIEYVYDPNANIVLERQGDKSISYAYNLDGSKRFIGYEGMHFNLMRNSNGVLERIIQGAQFLYQLEYNPSGIQTSLTYPNAILTKSAFDPLGRLTKRTLGETPLLQYTYDKSSRIISKNTTPITYDAGCRVTSAGDESYTYDEHGNLLKENTIIDPRTGALIQQGDTKFTYDMMGRLIQKNSPTTKTTYTYDVEGYLIGYLKKSVHGLSGSPRTDTSPVRTELVEVQLIFTYDPLGRRLTKHYKSDIEEYHHRYLYAGANIVAIYDNDTDELLATLLHEEDAIDSPLSIHIHPTELLSPEERHYYESLSDDDQYLYNQSRIKRYYYHRDHQNSIIALSDHNAQIVEYYEYDIYGNITKSEHTEGIKTLNPYRYTGREIDSGDLYYYRARYYDPTIGRFITPDPIGFLGGDTNFYRYVGNDPLNHIDPTGLSKCDTQEKKHKQSSEKLKNKQSFKWKKVLKSGAKKVGGGALFFIDGPIPIGDIFGAALLASDFADGVQAAQEIADASSELKSAAADLQKCQKQQQTQQTASKEKSGFKVGGEGEPPKNNNKKKKENLKCGEGGSYKDLKKKAAATVDMERDHAPSSAALLERARQLNAGEELTSAQKSAVSNAGHTLAIPKEIHASHSLTYKGRNTPTQISKDANNLAGAAKRDLAAIKKGLKPECKKEYEQYAKKIRKLSNAEYDAILKKAIGIE